MPEKRILLVEDEPTVYQLLAHILHAQGYHIDLAVTVVQAMAFLGAHSYSLVLTDWRLPDGDGLLIADTAAELGAKSLVMTGYAFQMPRDRAERHEILMKPLRPSEIVDAID